MRRPGLMLLCALALSVTAPAAASAAWTQAGGALNLDPAAVVQDPAIATVAGVPYVAWREVDGSGVSQVLVRHWDGSSWIQNGGSLNVGAADNAQGPTIADVGGVPYVAWTERSGSAVDEVFVKHWNGTTWVQDGGALNANAAEQAVAPWITAVGGVPYVAFQENIGSPTPIVYVKHWSGTTWVQDGAPLQISADRTGVPSIADVGGVPYVALEDVTTFNIFVEHLSGGSWVQDGGALGTAGGAAQPTIAVVNGVPYVAWQQDPSIDVAHWNGSGWERDGAALPPRPGASTFAQAIANVGGTPYVALTEANSADAQIDVFRLRGADWEQVGDPVAQEGASSLESLASVGGVPYLASLQIPQGANTARVFATRLTPGFSSQQAIATDTGALLTTRVSDSGTALPIAFQYGTGSTLTTTTAPQSTDGTGSSTIVQAITGLSPATGYSWRAIGTDGTSATAFSATSTFTTAALDGPGPTGPRGPTGPLGPQGPAGKIELVTCKTVTKTVVRRVHGRRRHTKVHVERCTTKLVSGPVRFTTSSARAAKLTRGRALYATVEVLHDAQVMRMVVIHRVRPLRRGSYTLSLGRRRETVQIT